MSLLCSDELCSVLMDGTVEGTSNNFSCSDGKDSHSHHVNTLLLSSAVEVHVSGICTALEYLCDFSSLHLSTDI